MTHSFSCVKVAEEDLIVKFEFALESGDVNEGLLKTVFGEYIEEPILMKSQAGQSFIVIGQCPLMDRMMHYIVEDDIVDNKIHFSISSQLFKNKIVEVVEEGESIMHLMLSDGTMVMLNNASDRAIAQIFYAFVLVDILNGMHIEVNIEEYYPNCRNCCMNKCNLDKYIKLSTERLQNYYKEKVGCVLGVPLYDESKKIVECGNFIRNKNPDIQEVLETISVVLEIENL